MHKTKMEESESGFTKTSWDALKKCTDENAYIPKNAAADFIKELRRAVRQAKTKDEAIKAIQKLLGK